MLVVDGSNLACEGRAVSNRIEHPSLEQLLGAVGALEETYPPAFVYVIVDASFRHAIDPSELPALEQALADKRLTLTPAGTEGKGDALVCAAAEKLEATVVSNDSFKELHDRHPWLFDGRVLGAVNFDGTWISEPRTPVRVKRGIFGRRRSGPAVDESQIQKVVDEALDAGSAKARVEAIRGR